MIKIVDDKTREELYSEFEFTDFNSIIENDKNLVKNIYDVRNFSVFQHWLTDKEFEDAKVMSYADNNDNLLLYKEYETKFLNFYSYLYDNTILIC
jgi:hypothetical protein